MCQKNGMKRFWVVVKTAAELYSPKPIVTLSSAEEAEAVRRLSQSILDKNLRFHIFDSLHERPQIHVLPIDIPYDKLR